MHSPLSRPRAAAMGFREFVLVVAMLMAVNALGVDTMLPALPAIGRSLGVQSANQAQWVVAAYMIGMGASQIVYGPLVDRFGRRPLILGALLVYTVTSLVAMLAANFALMVTARVLQGIGAAGARVLATAIVRDRFAGREMARVMSLSFIVFLAVPMLAPALGQLILLVAPWRAIFVVLATFAAGVMLWIGSRLPETLKPEFRRPIDLRVIARSIGKVARDRTSIGYTLALTMTFGAMMGFITSAQQIFGGVFGQGERFPLFFAMCAGAMMLASFTNSRIVMRLGTRAVSHSALVAYLILGAVHVAFERTIGDDLASFMAFQFAIMFFSGLMGANFGAMAMEPMAALAGTASSVQGMVSTLGGALFGVTVGQHFDGTTYPLATGYAVAGVVSLAMVLFAEGGRLFRSHHPAPSPS